MIQPAYDQVTAIASSLGSEAFRSLIVCRRTSQEIIYTPITPPPLVETVDQQMVELYQRAGEAEVDLEDYRIHISRRYALSDIVGEGTTYLLDADTSESPPTRGTKLILVSGVAIEKTQYAWQLTLREAIE